MFKQTAGSSFGSSEKCSVDLSEESEESKSRTSTGQDVSMILNHSSESLCSDDDFMPGHKPLCFQEPKLEMSMVFCEQKAVFAAYDVYESSVELLKAGFEAVKFNYCDMGSKPVRVFLS